MRRPAMQSVIEPGLMALGVGGWALAWQAVRRRLNMAADAAATEAVQWAGRLRADGATDPQVRVRWALAPLPGPGGGPAAPGPRARTSSGHAPPGPRPAPGRSPPPS